MGDATRVTGISLKAAHPADLARFYREALGVSVVEGAMPQTTEVAHVRIRGNQDGRTAWRILLETESAEDAEMRILGMGGTLESVTQIFSGQLVRGHDPEGNAFALFVREAQGRS